MRSKVGKISVALLALVGLLLIRFYESNWFYDPFLSYYAYDYLHQPFPAVDMPRLLEDYAWRFGLNSALSWVILRMVFGRTAYDRVILRSYVVLFLVLLFAISALLLLDLQWPMVLFYLRRFLIQPIWLLLCAGALWYFSFTAKASDS